MKRFFTIEGVRYRFIDDKRWRCDKCVFGPTIICAPDACRQMGREARKGYFKKIRPPNLFTMEDA